MGAITSKEGLLEYLKQAINVESAVLSQKNLIQEYDENSEERMPQLELLDMPEKPEFNKIQCPEKESYWLFVLLAILLVLGGGGSFLIGLFCLLVGERASTFFWIAAILIGIAIFLFWKSYKLDKEIMNKAVDSYKAEVKKVEEKNQYISSQYNEDMDIWENSNESAHAYFEKPLKETQAVLDKLYSVNVIYPKYRNLPALTCIYEYLVTGRCDELAGPHGAYNLYEDEVRQNMVISQLNAIMENLEQIKGNQYLLYEQLTKIRKESEEITHELRMIHGYAAALTEISLFNTYYAGISAANSTALAYYQTL